MAHEQLVSRPVGHEQMRRILRDFLGKNAPRSSCAGPKPPARDSREIDFVVADDFSSGAPNAQGGGAACCHGPSPIRTRFSARDESGPRRRHQANAKSHRARRREAPVALHFRASHANRCRDHCRFQRGAACTPSRADPHAREASNRRSVAQQTFMTKRVQVSR